MKTSLLNPDQLIDRFAEGRITRRQLLAGLFALMAASAIRGSAGAETDGAAAEPSSALFQATGLDHIALRVTDVPRSRDFYRDRLGMAVTRDGGEGSCFLSFDRGFLALFRGEEARLDHYCYSVRDYDVRTAEEKLKAAGLAPRVVGNRIYFEDPDGLVVQLATGQA